MDTNVWGPESGLNPDKKSEPEGCLILKSGTEKDVPVRNIRRGSAFQYQKN
jgi:hypothetical protein